MATPAQSIAATAVDTALPPAKVGADAATETAPAAEDAAPPTVESSGTAAAAPAPAPVVSAPEEGGECEETKDRKRQRGEGEVPPFKPLFTALYHFLFHAKRQAPPALSEMNSLVQLVLSAIKAAIPNEASLGIPLEVLLDALDRHDCQRNETNWHNHIGLGDWRALEAELDAYRAKHGLSDRIHYVVEDGPCPGDCHAGYPSFGD